MHHFLLSLSLHQKRTTRRERERPPDNRYTHTSERSSEFSNFANAFTHQKHVKGKKQILLHTREIHKHQREIFLSTFFQDSKSITHTKDENHDIRQDHTCDHTGDEKIRDSDSRRNRSRHVSENRSFWSVRKSFCGG